MKAELIGYEEFGRLRMQEFWPSSCKIGTFESHDTLIGYADGETYDVAYFVRNPESPEDVVEIRLEYLGPETCPDGTADRLFARLNLPLARGMSAESLVSALGVPVSSGTMTDGTLDFTFLCGQQWLYYVMCAVFAGRGLDHVMIVRKDLRDRRLSLDEAEDD